MAFRVQVKEKCIQLVLFALSAILFKLNQLYAWLKDKLILSMLVAFLSISNHNHVSSANKIILVNFFTRNGRSFTYIKNRNGPNIDIIIVVLSFSNT